MTADECDYVRCECDGEYTTGGGTFCLDHYVEKMRLARETEGFEKPT